MVMLTCPKTGKPFPSGVETDELSFDALATRMGAQGRNRNVPCPHCGQGHTWGSGGAYLAADCPAQQPLAEEDRSSE